jgi:hypothetical protein
MMPASVAWGVLVLRLSCAAQAREIHEREESCHAAQTAKAEQRCYRDVRRMWTVWMGACK